MTENAVGSTTDGTVWYDGTNFLGYADGEVQLDNEGGGGSGSEFWSMGIYGDLNGNFPGEFAGDVRSGFFFEAFAPIEAYFFMWGGRVASEEKTIQGAKIFILDRAGDYTEDVTLEFEIRDINADLQHTVTLEPIDMKTAPVGDWITLSLSETAADKLIDIGEFATFTFTAGDDGFGNFSGNLIAELEVE